MPMEELKLTYQVFDVETNGYLTDSTFMHCVAVSKIAETTQAGHENASIDLTVGTGNASLKVKSMLSSKDAVFVGHNVAGFDIPVTQKILREQGAISKTDHFLSYHWLYQHLFTRVWDTMLYSYIFHPERASHTLDSYGEEMGYPKGEHDDFSTYSKEMGAYCIRDVEVTRKLFLKQLDEFNSNSKVTMDCLILEAQVAYLQSQQELGGVTFDYIGCRNLLNKLGSKQVAIQEEVLGQLPLLCKPLKECKSPFIKSGDYSAYAVNMLDQVGVTPQDINVQAEFSTFEHHKVSLTSPVQVKKALLKAGWKPTQFNTKRENGVDVQMSPKLTEDSYASLPNVELGELLKTHDMLKHRVGYLTGIFKNMVERREDEQGKIEYFVRARALTCGTPTSRYRHAGAVCNPPRIKTPYGRTIRRFFQVARWRGEVMVGADLDGIEAKMLAHFCYNDQKLVERILSEDKSANFHACNAILWGVDYEVAKMGFYALIYGAGPAKIAEILGYGFNKGKDLMEAFWKENPAIKEFVETLEEEYSFHGYIMGIDGRPLHARSERVLLNFKLQNSATMVFKLWMTQVAKNFSEQGLQEYVRQMIAYHDELQYRVIPKEGDPDYVDLADVRSTIEVGANNAGTILDIKVPITCTTKLGYDWADCH